MNFYHHNNRRLQNLQCFPTAERYRVSRLAVGAVHGPDPPILPLLPRETTSLTEFFSIQEHILLTASSTPWPIISQKMRVILLSGSTYPLGSNSIALPPSATLPAFADLSALPHPAAWWVLDSVPCRAAAGPLVSTRASGESPLGLCLQR